MSGIQIGGAGQVTTDVTETLQLTERMPSLAMAQAAGSRWRGGGSGLRDELATGRVTGTARQSDLKK
jgi:hypothetical protein